MFAFPHLVAVWQSSSTLQDPGLSPNVPFFHGLIHVCFVLFKISSCAAFGRAACAKRKAISGTAEERGEHGRVGL